MLCIVGGGRGGATCFVSSCLTPGYGGGGGGAVFLWIIYVRLLVVWILPPLKGLPACMPVVHVDVLSVGRFGVSAVILLLLQCRVSGCVW